MAKDKEKPTSKSENFFERDIDPAVVERVEKLMGGDENAASESSESKKESGPVEPSGPPPPVADEPTASAPLLPSDKLPEAVTRVTKKEGSPEPKVEVPTESGKTDEIVPSPKAEKVSSHHGVDLDDPETEKAVDEIVKEEADHALAMEDNLAELEKAKAPKKKNGSKTLLVIVVLIAAAATVTLVLKLVKIL